MHIASMAAAMATEWAREPSQSRRDPPSDEMESCWTSWKARTRCITYSITCSPYTSYNIWEVLKPYGQFISSIHFHMQARQRDGAQYEKRSWCADVVQVVCGLCIDYSTLLIGDRRFALNTSLLFISSPTSQVSSPNKVLI